MSDQEMRRLPNRCQECKRCQGVSNPYEIEGEKIYLLICRLLPVKEGEEAERWNPQTGRGFNCPLGRITYTYDEALEIVHQEQ